MNVSPKARTSEVLCKPIEEQSQLLTSGWRPVYPQDDGRSSFLAADQWTDTFCLCKSFSCKACPEIPCKTDQ